MLLGHRTLPAAAVAAGMTAAAQTGRCDPDLVAVEARAAPRGRANPDRPTAHAAARAHPSTTTTGPRRPSPALAGYDELLQGELPGGEVPA